MLTLIPICDRSFAISAAIAAKSVGVANVVIVTLKPLEPACFISDFAVGRSYFS